MEGGGAPRRQRPAAKGGAIWTDRPDAAAWPSDATVAVAAAEAVLAGRHCAIDQEPILIRHTFRLVRFSNAARPHYYNKQMNTVGHSLY